ncbi:LacI family transcriptional regulator [Actinoplanes lobatus]|uniref:DNA-binding LacI/PurR family transcriptional regulator n=1 Tax=Actinoplanes lobatus TaxID=113568 RepID=A0A7W7MIT9_9ACTN|nr:LacI family DNA-binding transcriptional regulator [Actinoplanes lobatus]MBB4751849.1 DNA-binding LacI/PurR family transcriptional regulator [Actinoplanes lobatus]GGN97317.1 LacI family transcriptional regulator [Actinoplanes lobatus]GIE45673.1 LacI family transcriptional regulator [Actinoplanes lobatus]
MAARVTSSDVAALAGVSRATVSYVLTGNSRQTIPTETRERVRAAAAQLGYRVNAHARALVRGRSSLVLLILPDLPGTDVRSHFVGRATARIAADGYSLVLWTAGQGESLEALLENLTPAAVLTLFEPPKQDTAVLRAAGIPYFCASTDAETSANDVDAATGRLQVRHLAGAGHLRIGFLTTSDHRLQRFAAGRVDGARRMAAELGLPELVVHAVPDAGPARLAETQAVLRRWRQGPAPVTALCCYNDNYAALANRAAHLENIDIPGELSLIGVDDDEMSAFLDPPLTTVIIDIEGVADHLVAGFNHRLGAGPEPGPAPRPRIEVLPRESVARLSPEP